MTNEQAIRNIKPRMTYRDMLGDDLIFWVTVGFMYGATGAWL